MNLTGAEFFDELSSYHYEQNTIKEKYVKMRSLLERACKQLSSNEHIQFSNLFSRLNYVCNKTDLAPRKTYRINTFRIHANKVAYEGFNPGQEEYGHDLKALCEALSHFFRTPIPHDLHSQLPATDLYTPRPRERNIHARVRVEVLRTDAEYIHGYDEDHPTEHSIRIRHNTDQLKEFSATVSRLWPGCQLNLIDVDIDENGDYQPSLIILEPDYLVDISSLAECMKEYGQHPLHYVQNKFESIKNTKHTLLGTAANAFLDEFVNEKPEDPVAYAAAMRKVFKAAPFEFSTCTDLGEKEEEMKFFGDTRTQFHNIQRVVNKEFPKQSIDKDNAVIEPHFICEHLGVQGRLDFFLFDKDKETPLVIELKSGKAAFPETDLEKISLNHQSQAYIYQIAVQKVLELPFSNKFQVFVFYSKYTDPAANLRINRPVLAAIREILNIRNLIVANENSIAVDDTGLAAKKIIHSISPAELITNKSANSFFLEKYIIPPIDHFRSFFENAAPLELAYFFSFYSFVTKEQYLGKIGDTDYESKKGISSLWLSALPEKLESGEILPDLAILDNRTDELTPTILFSIPSREEDALPNFRNGDIVILYERNKPEDNVTNKQVFKGAIEYITRHEIKIRIRYRQRNHSVLPPDSKYAIEPDFLDSAHNALYRGLYAFLRANQDRKDLLLHQRPAQAGSLYLQNIYETAEMQQIVGKAKAAKDYFLLIGPPGTGKTSRALRSIVEEFYSDPTVNILLLSYTNRAVDEICDALDKVKGQPPYIRIGSELSCHEEHRKRLLDVVIRDCDNRQQVRNTITRHRIFVGTVSSVSNRPELFKLKHFQVAIIDEASQILEPALLGLLCAKNVNGGNAIDKFILIGDHKQLPAIVLQNEASSKVDDPALRRIGLTDRRNSLFERLYRLHEDTPDSPLWGMLHKQGRMHPAIAGFPNEAFYEGQLSVVPTPHQVSELEYKDTPCENVVQQLITSHRLVFIPSGVNKADRTNKTNLYEAQIAAALVKNIHRLYEMTGLPFSPEESLGIITPYRSQIALIKRQIHDLGIPILNDITVDTVERFQGSERDIIIYSFSVNRYYQLNFVASNMEDKGQLIDRKLNVALTRARKQLFVTGNPTILHQNGIFHTFIEYINDKGGYIDVSPDDFVNGKFQIS